MKKEINSFSSYYKWREKIENGEVDFYFKKYLDEMGLKVKKDAKPVKYVDVYVAGHWKRSVEAYSIEDTVEISRRKVNLLESTSDNLCKSLYLINKSAKISRDTKVSNYEKRVFKTVSGAKTRENKLYELKDKAIAKMHATGMLDIEGYHVQKNINGEVVLILYRKGDYSFHKPVFDSEKQKGYKENLKYLGIIEKISSERKEIEGVNFFEAKLLLENFIEEGAY